ncbi:acetolactate synthase small subunit [Paenibacillus vulneris]|uniref:Acetolactate synthase small subunit n=1 Tax=Paenibacillus vulneris TaxID=1133364 RepID=A0ABW3USW1_9BACL|nr:MULTISPECIES: acetolactate synthase small subunit [unclassified Paenibacillus]MBE1440772.1 acetolactate synthase-1/3 small subunit [Paenibacillus sp. OAS669]
MMGKHTLAILVNDQPGVLQRVCGLFGRRGFNIDSISVGGTEEPGLSRMTIVTSGDDRTLEQVQKQLSKLIDVISIRNISSKPMVSRELALIKIEAEPSRRPEILGVVETFRASVIDVGPGHMIIQAVGDFGKLDAMVELMRPYGIVELSYTGATAMSRGN